MELLASEVFYITFCLLSLSSDYFSIQGARLRQRANEEELDEVEEEEEEEEEEKVEEELGFISPLDNINPYVSFKQALTGKCVLKYFWLLLSQKKISFYFSLPNAKPAYLSGWHDCP